MDAFDPARRELEDPAAEPGPWHGVGVVEIGSGSGSGGPSTRSSAGRAGVTVSATLLTLRPRD